MTDEFIPVSTVRLGDEEERLVLEVLRSGQLAQGARVAELERLIASITDTSHAVAVNNGTTALLAALEASGVGPGDEVVTVPFTFVATLNAALQVGATVRFADVTPDFTVDVGSLSAELSDRTAAVIPVHLFGLPADMDGVMAAVAGTGASVIEDAAQALGARLGTTAAGGFGVGCFSLYATKNVTSGEGGVITTNDREFADRLRLLRNQGMHTRYEYEMIGRNYRLTDLHAAVAIPQLRRLHASTSRRQANAAALLAGLRDVPGLALPACPPGRTHVWHQFTVRVTPEAALNRDELAAALAARGVGSGIYYPKLVYDYACYTGHPQIVLSRTPRAEQYAREVLSLPVHPHLSDAQLSRIVEAVREALRA